MPLDLVRLREYQREWDRLHRPRRRRTRSQRERQRAAQREWDRRHRPRRRRTRSQRERQRAAQRERRRRLRAAAAGRAAGETRTPVAQM